MSDLPEWTGPPKMVGGHVAGPRFIARSANVVVAIRQVLAYPNGVEINIEAHAFGPSADGSSPVRGPSSADGAFFNHQPRFAVGFADGTEVVLDDEYWLRGGRGPTLMVSKAERGSGGPDNHEDANLALWLWPLPPAGPLTLTCTWERRGLDASTVLDGNAIRAAAEHAIPFWPEHP
ncbi:MAG TPA: hypothetical protein VJ914_02295 [Pseudonocardiaceae bacterium]|nr:hypothetical protein [Pseudonocardiaceae bacterium]